VLAATTACWLEVEFIDVRFPLTTAFDGNPADFLELFEVGNQTATGNAHILGYELLTGIAVIVLPCVAKKQGVREFGARRNRIGVEKEIRHHRKTTRRCGIGIAKTDIVVDSFEAAADVLHAANYSVVPPGSLGLSTLSNWVFSGSRPRSAGGDWPVDLGWLAAPAVAHVNAARRSRAASSRCDRAVA
jgi:hypothetical protein